MERRTDWFLMRVNDREREEIALLARQAGCSASEAVRSLIRKAVEKSERTPAEREGALAVFRP